jgi:outer membrane receptor protein involved in Fe transport
MQNILFSIIFTCLMSLQLNAQETVSNNIEEIVVTARATDESVRDIPVSITAYDQETLEALGVKDLQDLAASSAALEVGQINSGSGFQIAVRGISSSPGSIGIEQSVALMIDGVYYPQGRTIHEGLFDAGQVAILKGPQALYFGKNATAGAIVITSNDPGDELEWSAKISNEFEYKTKAAELIFSTPINDSWGVRLAVRTSKMDEGWIQNDTGSSTYNTLDVGNGFAASSYPNDKAYDFAPETENTYARLTLKGELSDRVTLKIKASTAETENTSLALHENFECPTLGGVSHVNSGTDSAGRQAPLPNPNDTSPCNKDGKRGSNPIPAAVAAITPLEGQFGGALGEVYESTILTTSLDVSLDNYDISTVVNFAEQKVGWVIDCDGTAFTSCFAGEGNKYENFALESKIVSKNTGAFNWAFGVYYQEWELNFAQEVTFANLEDSSVADIYRYLAYSKISQTEGETISVYGSAIFDINDKLQLTAGGRFIKEEKDSYFTQPYANAAVLGLFNLGRLIEVKTDLDDFVPEVTLRYQPNDNTTYYVAYKEGWKSGGFDNGTIDSTLNADPYKDIQYDPETVKGFEFGVKTSLLDGNLQLDLDVYSYEYDDLQLNYFNAAIFAYRTLNAQESESQGFDLALTYYHPTIDGLLLNAAVSYNDAAYNKFTGPCYSGQKPSEGCNIGTGALKDQNLDGKQMALAPELRINYGFNYVTPVGNGLELGLNANAKYSDDYLLTAWIDASQESYTSFDASVFVSSPEKGWSLGLIGRNLSDEYIQTISAETPSTGGNTGTEYGFAADRYAYVKPGRTIMLELSYKR